MTLGVPGTPGPTSMPPAPPPRPIAAPAATTDDVVAPAAPPAAPGEAVALGRPGWPPAPVAEDDWPGYADLFGQAPYVRDPADARLRDLLGAALAAEPELRRPPLGPALAAGRVDAAAVEAVQAMLADRGFDLGPAGADGKFGPKTHAALVAFLRDVEAGGPGTAAPAVPPPAPSPPAAPPPQVGPAGAPTITQTRHDPGYQLGAPPPAGYRAFRGAVPPEVGLMARKLLGKPHGTETYFEANGRRYVARNEPHYHPPGFKGGPNGWHTGVTVYEAT